MLELLLVTQLSARAPHLSVKVRCHLLCFLLEKRMNTCLLWAWCQHCNTR